MSHPFFQFDLLRSLSLSPSLFLLISFSLSFSLCNFLSHPLPISLSAYTCLVFYLPSFPFSEQPSVSLPASHYLIILVFILLITNKNHVFTLFLFSSPTSSSGVSIMYSCLTWPCLIILQLKHTTRSYWLTHSPRATLEEVGKADVLIHVIDRWLDRAMKVTYMNANMATYIRAYAWLEMERKEEIYIVCAEKGMRKMGVCVCVREIEIYSWNLPDRCLCHINSIQSYSSLHMIPLFPTFLLTSYYHV